MGKSENATIIFLEVCGQVANLNFMEILFGKNEQTGSMTDSLLPACIEYR